MMKYKYIFTLLVLFLIVSIIQCDTESPSTTPTPTIPPTLDCPAGQWQAGFECVSETKFRAPITNKENLYYSIWHADHWNGDQDPLCQSYFGGNFGTCYAGHDGTDFMLQGAFDTMDEEIAFVYAAADGEVISVEDGHYDRCHGDISTFYISCDGNPLIGNHVIIEHADGLESLYWHFKKDSIQVQVGDKVKCGEVLGLVGSSGVSFAPHLHFEVHLEEGSWVDPFAGDYSQDKSYWVNQEGPYAPNNVPYTFPDEVCQGYTFDTN